MNHQPYQEAVVPTSYLNNLENKKQGTSQESEIDKKVRQTTNFQNLICVWWRKIQRYKMFQNDRKRSIKTLTNNWKQNTSFIKSELKKRKIQPDLI